MPKAPKLHAGTRTAQPNTCCVPMTPRPIYPHSMHTGCLYPLRHSQGLLHGVMGTALRHSQGTHRVIGAESCCQGAGRSLSIWVLKISLRSRTDCITTAAIWTHTGGSELLHGDYIAAWPDQNGDKAAFQGENRWGPERSCTAEFCTSSRKGFIRATSRGGLFF